MPGTPVPLLYADCRPCVTANLDQFSNLVMTRWLHLRQASSIHEDSGEGNSQIALGRTQLTRGVEFTCIDMEIVPYYAFAGLQTAQLMLK